MNKGLQVKLKFIPALILLLPSKHGTHLYPNQYLHIRKWPCRCHPAWQENDNWKHQRLFLRAPNPDRATTSRGGCRTLSQVYNSTHRWGELRKVPVAWKVNQVFLNAYHFCSFLILEGKPVNVAQHSKSLKARYNMVWCPTHTHQDHNILLITKGQFPLYIWGQQNVE